MTPKIWLSQILTPLCLASNLSANTKKTIFLDFQVFWSPICPYKPKKLFDLVRVSENLKFKNLIFQILKKMENQFFFKNQNFWKSTHLDKINGHFIVRTYQTNKKMNLSKFWEGASRHLPDSYRMWLIKTKQLLKISTQLKHWRWKNHLHLAALI